MINRTPISKLCDACHKHFGMDCEPLNCEMAKVVKQLEAERDAAISAIERSCKYCKHGSACDDYDCITDRVDNWEWIGLSLAAETSDKEGKYE